VPRAAAEERIASLLELMGLAERADDGVGTYSGGMRRRLEIARGLLARPRVLFLDEPTVGLDPAVRAEIWHLIGRLREQEGVTIVLTTHYLEEAEAVCDRVGILHRARLAALGEPRKLIGDFGAQLLELRVSGDGKHAAAALAAACLGTHPPVVAHGVVSLTSRRSAEDLTAATGRLRTSLGQVSAATVRSTTLNDVYLHLTAADVDQPAATP
jgi:ABC-2 type transport system ATP-binding protein